MTDFGKFEEKIGITFSNKDLLKQAFIHRSYINENKSFNLEHNERLEFLGDAVLELIITSFLYDKFKEKNEGELTSLRSALVNSNTLSAAASKLEMNDFLLLSKGESKDVGRARQYILANTFEAFVGAVYMDSGYKTACDFILRELAPVLDTVIKNKLWVDDKSLFQEKSQEIVGVTPMYKTLKEVGPDHDKKFTVGVFLGEDKIAEGTGDSKQEAEQESACNALKIKNWN